MICESEAKQRFENVNIGFPHYFQNWESQKLPDVKLNRHAYN
jgi:hypothetical protein